MNYKVNFLIILICSIIFGCCEASEYKKISGYNLLNGPESFERNKVSLTGVLSLSGSEALLFVNDYAFKHLVVSDSFSLTPNFSKKELCKFSGKTVALEGTVLSNGRIQVHRVSLLGFNIYPKVSDTFKTFFKSPSSVFEQEVLSYCIKSFEKKNNWGQNKSSLDERKRT